MSATELHDVEALLEQVLPDPKGFVERVVQQLMVRLAVDPSAAQPGVVESYDTAAHEALVDRNLLLAAALGACDCWGHDPGCAICEGAGSVGWIPPDPQLYRELVEPAVDRMTTDTSEGQAQPEEGHSA